jgi:hypothetical protein
MKLIHYSDSYSDNLKIIENENKKQIKQKNNFTIKKFDELNLNENKKNWYLFYRKYLNPHLKLFKNFEEKIINKFSKINEIDKSDIKFNSDLIKIFFSTSLCMGTRKNKPDVGKRYFFFFKFNFFKFNFFLNLIFFKFNFF